jgi:acetoacetyl-CoA synthetase
VSQSLTKVAVPSQLSSFMRYVEAKVGQRFADWEAFHRFSVTEFRTFWRLFLTWSGIASEGSDDQVCEGDDCERAHFFPALRLSYAENLLVGASDSPALTGRRANGSSTRINRGELRARVLNLAASLDRLGVRPGDRIVCIARNNPEAVVAALATSAVGAVFSSCGSEMGAFSMISRFRPLAPSLLFANTAAAAADTGTSLEQRVAETVAELPSLSRIVLMDDGPLRTTIATHRLDELSREPEPEIRWIRREFDHPLFAMFSSGTTGAPKCMLHGVGGTLLEHVKEHRLHCDLQPGERLFFQTSCGWMMWNWQLSALASGAELVLYDGPLSSPETLWRIVAEERVSVFGTSPAYLRFCEDSGVSPRGRFDLSALRSVLSTGSILYPRQFDWFAAEVGSIPLQSISGGTDIIGCFVLGNPDLPVRRGEAQCRSLGLDVRALSDEQGAAIGELVCANPFPSRPIGLWDDASGERFHNAYFAQHPGFWTHGDLIEFTEGGGARMHGRSDGVLNIRGVRVGPAEIYAALQDLPEIAETMAVEQTAQGEAGGSRLVLLIVLRGGAKLDSALAARIRSTLLRRGSAAMVPARIADVSALPETHNGKRSEAAARAAVNGRQAGNRAALRNPECLDEIAAHPVLRQTTPVAVSVDTSPFPLGVGLEDTLQEICERTLEVAPIGHSDNLLTVRGDSLATLNLCLEVERRSGRHLSFEALMAKPTIEGLAALVRGSETAAADIGVRAAQPADIPALCELLHEASHDGAFAPMNRESWRSLFDYEWLKEKPNLGYVLLNKNTIVGFLGTIYAHREIDGKKGVFCNYTSWYVRPEYRGSGIALLRAAMSDNEMTYTSFTPNALSRQAFEMLHFSRVGNWRVLLPPLWNAETLRSPRAQIYFETDKVRGALGDCLRRVFDDHAPHCLQLLVRDGSQQALIVVKRRPMPVPRLRQLLAMRVNVPYSEILYCSEPRLLARHLERVKLAILRRQKTAFLIVDSRLFERRPRGIAIPDHALFRSPFFDSRNLDKLYSELVLLPL